jgi:hypothetical protein
MYGVPSATAYPLTVDDGTTKPDGEIAEARASRQLPKNPSRV